MCLTGRTHFPSWPNDDQVPQRNDRHGSAQDLQQLPYRPHIVQRFKSVVRQLQGRVPRVGPHPAPPVIAHWLVPQPTMARDLYR
jgi:hypothetical protein